ncbi:MAG: MOSC domain-containing protein, partial [Rubrobacter sp.]
MDHTTATALNYYPIKSCAGTSVESLDADTLGPTYDRRFMLVDQDGIFLSQRELPELSLITPKVEEDSLHVEAPGM